MVSDMFLDFRVGTGANSDQVFRMQADPAYGCRGVADCSYINNAQGRYGDEGHRSYWIRVPM